MDGNESRIRIRAATSDASGNIAPRVLAVGADEAAAMVGLSRRTWFRMMAEGSIPQSFKLGAKRVWRTADIELWVEQGFPNREEFEATADRSE